MFTDTAIRTLYGNIFRLTVWSPSFQR